MADTLLQNYTYVLEIILRLRQICDHGYLVPQDCPIDPAAYKDGSSLNPSIASNKELVERLINVLKVRLCYLAWDVLTCLGLPQSL